MNVDKHGVVEMTKINYNTDRPKAANPVKICDLTFRDGHQSLFATRGRTEDMIGIAKDMDKAGFYAMEVWGGATFDTMHRFLNEDPWERVRTLKKYISGTPFSMLLRGQNLVGYRNYADDVVEAFVQQACDTGIDIFRVFDALNDFRNFQTAVKIIQKNKKHFQGTICYSLTEPRMGGEVYNLDYYQEKALQLENMGADSICIKDMAGLIAPYDAYNLVKMLKATVKIPIQLHTHFTSGMADLALLKAVEAGVDIIDTCMSPYAYRTSHTAIEPLVVTLLGTNRDTGMDVKFLAEISNRLETVVPKYRHFMDNTRLSIIDTNVLLHQTPGGMLSNLVNQLRQMGELDKLPKVFEELPKVRRDLGQIPLVTPTSQIVGIQTVNNVLFDKDGESYSKITEQVKALCFGLYGATPRPMNKELQAKALKDFPQGQTPITDRPGSFIGPELEKAKAEIKDLAQNLDDTLVYALFPVTGKKYLQIKYGHEPVPAELRAKTMEEVEQENLLVEKALKGELVEKSVRQVPVKPDHLRSFDVYIDDEYFKVEVSEQGEFSLSAHPIVPRMQPKMAAPQPVKQAVAKPKVVVADGQKVITAPMPGMIVSYQKKVGDKVSAGETVLIIEAMKMNNTIEATGDGVVKEIPHKAGDSVAKGDILCVLD